MIKTRNYSVYTDFHTGFLYKLFIIIGIILVVFYFIEHSIPFIGLQESNLDAILAFAVLFIGGSFLLFFMHRQFVKLAQIAEEIENDEEITPDE